MRFLLATVVLIVSLPLSASASSILRVEWSGYVTDARIGDRDSYPVIPMHGLLEFDLELLNDPTDPTTGIEPDVGDALFRVYLDGPATPEIERIATLYEGECDIFCDIDFAVGGDPLSFYRFSGVVDLEGGDLLLDRMRWGIGAWDEVNSEHISGIVTEYNVSQPVPEPTAALVFGAGLGVVARAVRRREG